jgi:hypothetical protein
VTRVPAILLAVGLAAAAGCQSSQIGNGPIHDDRGAYNRWAVETVNDGAVRNAIIAQHTLYPYHFADNSADLNEVGKRDVAVLASHFRRYPGQVNLRKGSEDSTLYQARVRAIADGLVAGGVAPGTVRIGDGMPGGDGMDASRVILIMETDAERLKSGGTGAYSAGSNSSTGSTTAPSSSTNQPRSSSSTSMTGGGY